ncbi:MAN2 [Mytilus edulis]|uniref:MAN2 n=1 Tax=Mytilus edulis TaxID=6550 RepID=A0A8S3Q621_MYTED|nr:MAN2 [Mytilus edulis]
MNNSDFSSKNFTETPENEQYNLKQRSNKQSTREENKNTINMREYAQQLAPWIYQYRLWTAISTLPPTFPHQAMSCMQFGGQQMFQSFGSAPVYPTPSPIIHNQIGATPQNRNQRNISTGQGTTTNRLGSNGMGVHIENLVNISNGTIWNNKELIMRIETDVKDSDNQLCVDLNGFQMHRKKTRKKIPLQGNFFPMTSMMSIENNVDRVTIVSSETHGVASLSPGWFEVVLDRRLIQDDWRTVSGSYR